MPFFDANDPRSLPRRGATLAVSVAMMIVGVVFDFAALVNVPGATAVGNGADDQLSLTDLGTPLALCVIAAWATVLWRSTRPWLVWSAGALLAIVGVSYVLLLIGAVACVRRYPRRTTSIAIATSVLVLLFAIREGVSEWGGALPWFFTSRTDAQYEPQWIVASFGIVVVSLGTAAVVALALRSSARVQRSDARAAAERQRADDLTERMLRQAERDRIARDMHDTLAHRLSVVSLHAGALEADKRDNSRSAEIARTVREQTHAALQDMRGLIGDLRSGPGAAPVSPATMRGLGSLLSGLRNQGVNVHAYVVLETPERASTQFDIAVYRIVQESLTNAMRNAPGAAVDLYVHVDPQQGARIRVTNPLGDTEVPAVPGGGHGIVGIRERAAALEGTAWIGPYRGDFLVDVVLPWQERDDSAR